MAAFLDRRPRLLLLLLALTTVAGLTALATMPRAEDPTLTGRNASVFTPFPGADAGRVEVLVTDVIEDRLATFEEIQEVLSTSTAGMSAVQIELADAITEVDPVWTEIRDELAELQDELPAGAGVPDLEDFTVTAYTRIVGLTYAEDAPDAGPVLLGRLGEELADRLRAVGGTADADLFGRAPEELAVIADPGDLATRGLSVTGLAAALTAGDAKVDAGTLRGADDLLVQVAGEVDAVDRARRMPVRVGDGGATLRLEDVATVTKGVDPDHPDRALVGGRPGVVVAARMVDDERVDRWAARTDAALAAFEAELPVGVALTTLFDQSVYTEARLGELFGNFLAAVGLVMAVLLLTMGLGSALLVGTALPLVTFLVLFGMDRMGLPMNQMSIAGLIIALGLLIDNAIVMVDHIRGALDARREAGDPLTVAVPAAITDAVRHLAMPLSGSTLTTALAFMPIVLMPGPSGEFTGPMALTVVLAVASSLFVALVVLPPLAGLLERWGLAARGDDGRRPLWATGFRSDRATAAARATLRRLVARPALGIAVAGFLPLLGFAAAAGLEEQFFPPADRDHFLLELELERSAGLDATTAAALDARDFLLGFPEVTEVHWFVGKSAPKFYYNLIELRRVEPHYGAALVQLDRAKGSLEIIRRLQDALDERFGRARLLARQMEQGPPFEAPIELHLTGPDLVTLRALGEQLRAELAQAPGIEHTAAKLVSGRPTLEVVLDEERARLAGLDNRAVAGQLAAALDGQRRGGASLVEGTEELPLRVRVDGTDRADVARLGDLELATPGGGWTPLAGLARLELVPEAASIPHRGGVRSNTVQGYTTAGLLPSGVLAAFQERIAASDFALPPGYAMTVGGESAERDSAVGGLLGAAGMLLVLMVASLVLSFDSFRLAGLIGLVGLLAVGLAMLALRVFGFPFGFMAIVGTMGLVGVAINDSIVVLASLDGDERARTGDPRAIAEVTLGAMRHVVSTTLTTVVGFLPLFLGGGSFWPPVAVTIGGGVLGATQLALTLVPTLYGVHRRRVGRKAASDTAPAPAPDEAAPPALQPA